MTNLRNNRTLSLSGVCLLLGLGLNLSLGLASGFSAQAAPPAVELGPRAKAKLQSGEYPLLENVGSILEKVANLRQLPIKESVKVDKVCEDKGFIACALHFF